MILRDGQKWACRSCITGHRSSKCTHEDRELFPIAKKGRPSNQCQVCQDKKNGVPVPPGAQCFCQAKRRARLSKIPRTASAPSLIIGEPFEHAHSDKRRRSDASAVPSTSEHTQGSRPMPESSLIFSRNPDMSGMSDEMQSNSSSSSAASSPNSHFVQSYETDLRASARAHLQHYQQDYSNPYRQQQMLSQSTFQPTAPAPVWQNYVPDIWASYRQDAASGHHENPAAQSVGTSLILDTNNLVPKAEPMDSDESMNLTPVATYPNVYRHNSLPTYYQYPGQGNQALYAQGYPAQQAPMRVYEQSHLIPHGQTVCHSSQEPPVQRECISAPPQHQQQQQQQQQQQYITQQFAPGNPWHNYWVPPPGVESYHANKDVWRHSSGSLTYEGTTPRASPLESLDGSLAAQPAAGSTWVQAEKPSGMTIGAALEPDTAFARLKESSIPPLYDHSDNNPTPASQPAFARRVSPFPLRLPATKKRGLIDVPL